MLELDRLGAPKHRGMIAQQPLPVELAQVEVQIPSGTQLDRMEEEHIATPPLDVGAYGAFDVP